VIRVGLLVPLVLAVVSSFGRSDEKEQVSATATDRLQTERIAELVGAAQRYLVERQNADGSFSLLRNERESGSDAPIAVTALASLSLMAAGRLPDHDLRFDRQADAVRRSVRWLVDHCVEQGPQAGFFTTDGDTVSRMHGHGYALLALTQAVGMYGGPKVERDRLHAAIDRGVDLVQRTQGTHGGWYYEPERTVAHEGSITVCMIQALRGAKEAGFVVDLDVVRRAEEYMQKSQDETTGKFRYQIGSDVTSWSLTAAALATLNALGDYSSPTLRDGFDALQRHDPYTGAGKYDPFAIYGAFYAAQAYWAWGDRRLFDGWWPHFVDDAERRQRDDGSFQHGKYGRMYATAMVSLTLQVPFGYLPMFQR